PDDPRNYTEAMSSPDADQWIVGTHEELNALRSMGVYNLVHPSSVPRNKTLLDLKPVYTVKRGVDGSVVHYKVRYCILG
ncbi:hypothetical protein DFH06DRAFT_967159, partial [Mycena polygramma]